MVTCKSGYWLVCKTSYAGSSPAVTSNLFFHFAMAARKTKKSVKYRAKKVVYDGIEFDSETEGKRYLTLKQAQEAGLISDLELQPKYIILPAIKGTRVKHFKRIPDRIEEYTIQQPSRYTADFRYIKDSQIVVEEVKGSKWNISRDFPLRKRMLRYFHGIDVKMVFDPNEPI